MASVRRIVRPLFCVVLVLGIGVASAQESSPEPPLTESQKAKIKEAEPFWKQASELFDKNKPAEATIAIKKAVEIEREAYGDEHFRTQFLLTMLAQMYELQEQFLPAAAVFDEIQSILTKQFGKADWRVTDARISADIYRIKSRLSRTDLDRLTETKQASAMTRELYSQGKFAEAIEKLTFIAERCRELLGEENLTYAISLAKLGVMYAEQGNYEQAESLYQKAISIEKKIFGELHPQYATTLNNLAVLYDEIGEFAKGERLYRQAMEIRRQTLGEKHNEYATSLNNLAVHFDLLGDFAKAEPLHLQAVEVIRQTQGEQHADYITALSNLGRSLQARGEYTRAEPYLVKALELRKQVFGEKHHQYAASLNNLASLYSDQNDPERAEPLYRQALDIWKQTLGEQHANCFITLCHLADLHDAKAEFSAAETLYREVLSARRRVLGEKHPQVVTALSRLSLTLLHQQKFDEALTLARQAVEIDRHNVEAVVSIQSDRQQFLTAKQSYATLDTLLSVLVATGRATDADYNEILQAKGRVWQRQRMARAAARTVANRPELVKLMNELKSLAAGRAKLTLNVPDAKDQDQWRNQIAALTERQESLERELAEKSLTLRASRQNVTPEDVRRELPEGAVVVDLFEYLHVLTPPIRKGSAQHEKRLVAFVLKRDVPGVTFVPLGNVKPIAKAIDTWRQSFGKQPEAQAAGKLLKQKIWEPLEPHLKGTKTVLVSPDGVLGRFPLAALPGRDPDSYLLEDVALAIVPCVMAIPQLLKQDVEQRIEVAGNLLVVANVDYDSIAASRTTEPVKKFGRQAVAVRGADWKGFLPLDGTRGELASIEKLYRETFGREGITLLEAGDAREERFCEEAVRHKFLHVATHGFFAPGTLRSVLQDNQEQARSGTTLSQTSSQFFGYPPGLLSGLALAGANRNPEAEREDGILTASEVENLDLRGVQLAVLSACETGLGEVAGGEGLLGLQRAFQVAGAQTVVASLWQVSDTATRNLMERFYDNLLHKQMGTLDALREAQLWMLREGQTRGLVRIDEPSPPAKPSSTKVPPFFWAAFVLSGDWR